MALYDNILETIGNTPMVRLKKIEKLYELKVKLYAKLESFNPANNVKVRPAYQMIKDLYDDSTIDSSYTIIEATSGNTGIGLAMVGAYFGNKVIITMPSSVSKERADVLKHYGAKVILTEAEKGITGANELADELLKKIDKSIKPSQFQNPSNPKSHFLTTAKEIYQDLPIVDYIFSTIGTGGTITGIAQYVKANNKNTKIIGIEPASSPLITKGYTGKHKIQGIAPGFIPEILNLDLIDEFITVSDEDSYKMTKSLPQVEGISIGISSGACLISAINYIKENNLKNNESIVLIFPDSGEKYFSTEVFN
ncbi:MAG: cysteine synthase family protein [Candidatus Izemoplasmatales bacterium]|jgi:cysteine synthase A|nr:cysteine synthase family protein [Candidatus Izemoplasmatales bacterium]